MGGGWSCGSHPRSPRWVWLVTRLIPFLRGGVRLASLLFLSRELTGYSDRAALESTFLLPYVRGGLPASFPSLNLRALPTRPRDVARPMTTVKHAPLDDEQQFNSSTSHALQAPIRSDESTGIPENRLNYDLHGRQPLVRHQYRPGQ